MRVLVTGGTGNVGTSVVRALADDPGVEDVHVLARRSPGELPGAHFTSADVAADDLVPLLRGVDVVIHLAWLIQPGRDHEETRRVNVLGSRRVFDAAVRAGVPALVHASSVGAYSPGPKSRRVEESWPAGGIPSSFYSRQKAAVERLLDGLSVEQPNLRVVRLRPGLIFKREAASEIRRLFLGPFVPRWIFQRRFAPIVPAIPRLCFQAVHSDDVGEAYRRAALSDVSGAFNIAAEPPIDAERLAGLLDARPLPVPARVARAGATAAFVLRLTPTEPGWLDMGLGVPTMSIERARRELGWEPRLSAEEALGELAAGLREGAGGSTPTLAAQAGGPLRVRELLTRVGARL
jgi:UDP-glucose 4-epimerase